MPKIRKAKHVLPKKIDPGKAAIYAALVTLLGVVSVAVISNIDKFRPKNQVEEIIAFQEHQYDDVTNSLDERAKQAEGEKATSLDPQKVAQAEDYLKENNMIKVAVAKKHSDFKAAVRRGDFFSANVIKTEVNNYLNKDSRNYSLLHLLQSKSYLDFHVMYKRTFQPFRRRKLRNASPRMHNPVMIQAQDI